jgi:hypothetical protein
VIFIGENLGIIPCYKTGCIVLVLANPARYFSDVKNKVKAKISQAPVKSGSKSNQKAGQFYRLTTKNKQQSKSFITS